MAVTEVIFSLSALLSILGLIGDPIVADAMKFANKDKIAAVNKALQQSGLTQTNLTTRLQELDNILNNAGLSAISDRVKSATLDKMRRAKLEKPITIQKLQDEQDRSTTLSKEYDRLNPVGIADAISKSMQQPNVEIENKIGGNHKNVQ